MVSHLLFYLVLNREDKAHVETIASQRNRPMGCISQVSLELINEPNRKAFGVSLY